MGRRDERGLEENDFTELTHSPAGPGFDDLGFEVPKPTYERIFREPDSVRRSLEGSTAP